MINNLISYEDETIESYFYRVAFANKYSKHLIYNNFVTNKLSSVEEVRSVLLRINEENQHFFVENTTRYIKSNGLFQFNCFGDKISRYCPLCLIEKVYHRIHWFIAPVFTCSKHNIYLLHLCKRCYKKVSFHDVMKDQCSYCMSKLSLGYYRNQDLASEVSQIMNHGNIRDKSPVWLNLTLEEYFVLLKKIIWLVITQLREELNLDDTKYIPKKDRMDWYIGHYYNYLNGVEKAHYLLLDWPKNIRSLYLISGGLIPRSLLRSNLGFAL